MNIDRLMQMSKEEIDLMVRKNKAYSGNSGDNITAGGLHGVATRLMDKVSRLSNLTENPQHESFESVEDTLIDISNYAHIGRLLKEGEWKALPTMIYLAGPIDGVCDGSSVMEWRLYLSNVFGKYGITTFNPMAAFHATVNGAKRIRGLNDMAIVASDLVIANLSGEGKGFGTMREIEYAVSIGKPVIVIWSENDHIPLYAYDVENVYGMESAIKKVLGNDI